MTVHPETSGTRTVWRALAWSVAGLTVACTVLALVVSPVSPLDGVLPALIPIFFAVLGVLIVVRQPRNRIAWLFLVLGPTSLLEAVGRSLVADHPEPPNFWEVLTLAGINSGFFVAGAVVFLAIYLFPTGHFLNRRWSWAGWFAIGLSLEVFFVYLFLDTVGLCEFPGETWCTPNPIGFIPREWWSDGGPLQLVFGLMLLALIFGAVPAVVVRYRRSSATVRAQIKWVALAFVVFVVISAINLLTPGEGDIWGLLLTISEALLPVVIALAIIRYRLFEIDRIISRTLGYAIVLAVVTAAFSGLVTVTTVLLPGQDSLAVAASTLAVAAIFNPLRKRVQKRIDRRFNRSAYQAELISRAFAGQLSQQLTTDELVQEWKEAVDLSLQPTTSGVWIRARTDT